MTMHPFDYRRAASLEDAKAAYGRAGDPRLLAGGQTLIPTLKQRLAQPDLLIDISRIESLKGVREVGGALEIGATTPHADVAANALVRRLLPALAELAGGIGDPHVRARGTIGGSLANNDPAADYPAAALALRADILTDRRTIAADAFFQGMFSTALESGEIITAVRFRPTMTAAYEKFRSPASRYALVGVFVAKRGSEVRVTVTGAGPGVFRLESFERALTQDFSPAAIAGLHASPDDLTTDIHGSAEYRAHLIGVLAARAVARAAAGLGRP